MIMMFALLMQIAEAHRKPLSANIEVDQEKNEFRIVLSASKVAKIYPWDFESPGSGLPPRNIYVLVRNGRGDIVGCGEKNTPHIAAAVSSNSTPIKKIKPLRLGKGQSFVTPWHKVAPLFVFFDECVKPQNRGGYVKYKILMRSDTSAGHLESETEWLDFPGYETSAWRSVNNPPKKP